MEPRLIPALNAAQQLFQTGKQEFYVRNYLSMTYPSLSSDDLSNIVFAAGSSWRAAQQAESGKYTSFGQLPGLAGQEGPYVARVFLQGWVGDRPISANFDVIVQGGDSISAVNAFVQEYYNDVLWGRVSLPGGSGVDVPQGETSWHIISVVPQSARWSTASTTFGGE